MAHSIRKSINDLTNILKKNPAPNQKNSTIWDSMKDQLSEEGTWDENLINSIEQHINQHLEKIKEDDLRDMWMDTETAAESMADVEELPIKKVKTDLTEDILHRIMDKVGESDGYDDEFEENSFYDREPEGDDIDDEFSERFDKKKKTKADFDEEDDFKDSLGFDDEDDFDFNENSLYDEDDKY